MSEQTTGHDPTTHDHAAVVRRYVEEGYNEKDPAVLRETMAEDVVVHGLVSVDGPAEGLDAYTEYAAELMGAFPDVRGEVPKAFVVPSDGHTPDEGLREELQGHVKQRLAKYEYPRELEFVEELPRTTTGKVRRQSLREGEGLAD